VKLFQLTEPKPASGSSLRIRKLELPPTTGARLVRLAQNGKWLSIITATNEIYLGRVIGSEDATERPRVLRPLVRLHRLSRDNKERDSLTGPLGDYNRSISYADFSDDGVVFAAADLAGYVDTWVVEGHEDSTALEVDIDQSLSAPVEDDESEEEEDIPTERVTFLGQRWIRNPSGHLLPRLDSAPLLLSFQPGLAGSTRLEPNGNPAVHPTRHNPHPHSHDLPSTKHNLLLVSAEHQLYHFEVLTGRLSEWSRRNPISTYPSQFRLLDNPTKGCTWDITEDRQRVWLYGEKWLFMFDLAHDLPLPGSVDAPTPANSIEDKGMPMLKKRKRASIKDLPWKSNSGAGGAVPDEETIVTKLRKFNSGPSDKSPTSTWIDLNNASGGAESDEKTEDRQQALASIRRSAGRDGVSIPSQTLANDDLLSGENNGGGSKEDVDRKRSSEPWWHTFKYRPILGMVSVGKQGQPHEVILVERPSWDLDLGPRFVSSHE
jgi:U3 small nucleolar RNA-associated protein 4